MQRCTLLRWAFIVALAVFCVLASSSEQKPISRDALVVSLRRVSASAEEQVPFVSIKSRATSGMNEWATTFNLPGANSCAIRLPFAEGQVASQSSYDCTWKFASDSQAGSFYDDLFEKILRSGDWMGKPFRENGSLKEAVFSSSIGGRVGLHISLKQGGVVILVVTAGPEDINISMNPKSAGLRGRVPPNNDSDRNPPEQVGTPKTTVQQTDHMDMGGLAVVADRRGSLVIDGEAKSKITPGKIVTVKLTAGQHFVELRDAEGTILWKEVLTVPKGEQVARDIHAVQATSVGSGTQRDFNSSVPNTPTATLDNSSNSVADALTEIMRAGRQNFASIKGQIKREVGTTKTWYISVVVPGFDCSLTELNNNTHPWVSCNPRQGQKSDESIHLSIARALADRLRGQGYSCVSNPVAPIRGTQVQPIAMQSFTFRRNYKDSSAVQFLSRYTEAGLSEPVGSLRVSFLLYPVSSPLGHDDPPLDDPPLHDPPLECEFSYAALKSNEFVAPNQLNAAGELNENRVGGLGGEWLCEAGIVCDIVSVSFTGSRFSARLERLPERKGQSCDAVRFPKFPPPTGSCNFVFEFTGITNGSNIEGVVTMTAPPADAQGCGYPTESHRFNATLKENGHVIAINTEANENIYHWHDTRAYVWQKEHLVCDPVTVDRTSPVMMILRSKTFNGTSDLTSFNSKFSNSGGNIATQIDEIVTSGHYSSLPAAQALPGTGSQQPILSIKNQTAFQLTILMAGPVERSLSISPGGSQSVPLLPGTYRVVGKVNAPNVLPFFGTQAYTTGNSYEESFYIK